MLKFINSTTGNQNSAYALHAEQVHSKFLLCINSSLNSFRNLHFFNFIRRLLLKTLPLKFNELIPYF